MRRSGYGPLVRFLRTAVRPVFLGWKVSPAPGREPLVYVAHHRNMSGPVHALALLPDMPRPWVLHVFTDRKLCFDQYYSYTFSRRYGWPKPAAAVAAGALALAVPPVMRSFGAVPVYRGLKEAREMMERTVELLAQGERVLLCPDVDYASTAADTKDIYKGFLQLEKLYFARTGAHIPFVPLYCSSAEKRLVAGEAVCFTDGESFRAQREDVARRIVEGLNALAEAEEQRGRRKAAL